MRRAPHAGFSGRQTCLLSVTHRILFYLSWRFGPYMVHERHLHIPPTEQYYGSRRLKMFGLERARRIPCVPVAGRGRCRE